MKKLVLFLSAVAMAGVTNAQLSGSSYTQNFDDIGSGTLPRGWYVYTGADASTLGTTKTLLSSSKGTKYPWTNSTGAFKNVASANGHTTPIDSATQTNATDRALAVRQVGNTNVNFPNSDPGAAFVFKIDDTKNITDIHIAFQLQSLDDTSHRQTTWVVDYGIGATPPTFTELTTSPATLTTGGDVYANTTVTTMLPAAAENSLNPVYIRVRAKDAAIIPQGSQFTFGNRATTGIDDFKLTWTGTATSSVASVAARENLPMTVAATHNQITINYEVKKAGNYTVGIYDMSGREVYSNTIAAQGGKQKSTINDMNLQSGMYIIKLVGNDAAGVVKAMVE